MASSKKPAAAKAVAEPEAEAEPKVPEGHVFVYPTHKRGPGPLVVGLPAVDGESSEVVIDDDGAAVPKVTADYLVSGGEATTKKPKADEA